MGKLMLFILCFVLQMAGTAFAEEVNLLQNPDFESRTSRWSKTGSSTLTVESAAPLDGSYSLKWNPSATGEFFRSSSYTIPVGLRGRTCQIQFKYLWDTGTSGHILLNADDGTNNVASISLDPTSGGVSRVVPFNFTCPTSGTLRFELESTANADEITVDNAFLGSGRNTAQLSQSELTAFAYFPTTASCTWTLNSGTFADFPTDSDCPSITVVSSSQTVDTTDTNLPQIVFPSLLPGKYTVTVSANVALTVEESATKAIRVSDGTNVSPVCGSAVNVATGGSTTSNINCTLSVTYTTTGARTFKIQGIENGPTGSIQIANQNAFSETSFTVRRDPIQSAEALTLETSGWYFDANIGGGNPGMSTTSVATYTVLTNANLDMVLRTGSSSGKISCSGNPATGLTCAAGAEQVGVLVPIPYAGQVEACFDFTHTLGLNTGTSDATFQVVRTADASDTILEEGGSKVSSGHTGSSATSQIPNRACGIFNIPSAGNHAFKLFYEFLVSSGTVGTNQIAADRSATQGQRDIRVTVKPWNQAVPAPVFTEIREKVRSSTPGMRIEKVAIAYNCTSSPCTMVNPTSGISSVTRSGTGAYSVNFSPSFTVAPACTVSSNFSGGFSAGSLNGVATTSAQLISTALTTTGALSDQGFSVICMGLH